MIYERIRPIDGIFVLSNEDIYVKAWPSAVVRKENYGGAEFVLATELASPHIVKRGEKYFVLSPHNMIELCNPPSRKELDEAEILPPPAVELSLAA